LNLKKRVYSPLFAGIVSMAGMTLAPAGLQIAAVSFCTVLAGTVSVAQAASLDGSTVTATLYNPNLGTILGGPTSAIVGASTPTCPNGSIVGNTTFQINITTDQIFYNPLANVTYGNGVFNGFVFDFANAPDIIGVTLDGASTFTPTAISSTANSISLNLSGNTVNTSSVAILDIQLQAAPATAPEPATLALCGVSLGVLGLLRRFYTK
jgi:hypothetical protein